MKKLTWLLALLPLLFNGCKKDEKALEPFLGYTYFPLEVGHELYYQVDSIGWLGYTYDPVNMTVDIDTVNFQIKEVVDSYFDDNQGRPSARIVRYKRANSTEPWVLFKVYSAILTATTAERFEDNVRYVKLVFPPVENEKWIGQYINVPLNDTLVDSWEYEYGEVNVPGSVGGMTFDSTLTVNQKFDSNLISYRSYIEQYAAGSGMIYKEYKDFDYANINSSFIKNGFIYTETVITP